MTQSRHTIKIPSHGEELDSWFYPSPNGTNSKSPIIILGHGLGAVKDMGLDRYSELFQQAGYHAIAFDYRGFGRSSGEPRQIIDWRMQQDDWDAVLDYARRQPYVDADKIGIFGTSFGGGHVIEVASRNKDVKAVISQCPFTSGFASSMVQPLWSILNMSQLAIRDVVGSLFSNKTVNVTIADEPGTTALMSTHDTVSGYLSLVPPGMENTFPNHAAARLALKLPLLRPGSYSSQVKSPIFWAICNNDTVAPPGPTLKYAKKSANKQSVIKEYDLGHFDIYVGEGFKKVSPEYVEFLKTHIPPPSSKL